MRYFRVFNLIFVPLSHLHRRRLAVYPSMFLCAFLSLISFYVLHILWCRFCFPFALLFRAYISIRLASVIFDLAALVFPARIGIRRGSALSTPLFVCRDQILRS